MEENLNLWEKNGVAQSIKGKAWKSHPQGSSRISEARINEQAVGVTLLWVGRRGGQMRSSWSMEGLSGRLGCWPTASKSPEISPTASRWDLTEREVTLLK